MLIKFYVLRIEFFRKFNQTQNMRGQNSSKTFRVLWGRATDKDAVKAKLEVSQTTFVDVGFFSNPIKIF